MTTKPPDSTSSPASPSQPVPVYVPVSGYARATIDAGSGVVGSVVDDGRIRVDYEGNRYGAANLNRWADRVHAALDRHLVHYPTVARAIVPAADLVVVGSFDQNLGELSILDGYRDQVVAWLAVDDAGLDGQLHTSSARHQMRRDVARLRADPATRELADEYARRHRID
jgi:hypothetical protein